MRASARPRWTRADLAYCSNVHPGESIAELLENLRRFQEPIRRTRGLATIGAGLWLAHEAAAALHNDDATLRSFREALGQAGVELFTLNGFPSGGFHEDRVKQQVYRPSWAEPQRLHYTRALAAILAACLPARESEGTISTLPLGQAKGWDAASQRAALRQLCRLAAELDQARRLGGSAVRVCLEMEPGCVLERTEDAVRLFTADLPRAAAESGIAAEVLGRHLGVCFDVCHQAVMFEDAFESLRQLHHAGIVVGKIQLSSAIEASAPQLPATRAALAQFDEPRYLHQVRAPDAHGGVHGTMDLPEALASSRMTGMAPWRVHFHVPVHANTVAAGQISTTRAAIERTLDYLGEHPELRPHLEVETYTWHVLPDELRPHDDASMCASIARELQWTENAMKERGLLA